LTKAGHTATGIEASAPLARYARAAAPAAAVKIGSAHRAVLPPCSAITAIGEVLSYRATRGAHAAALRRLFRRAHAALPPGGLLVFDLLVEGPRMAYEIAHEGEGWAIVTRVTERRGAVVREIESARRIGRRVRRGRERHVLAVARVDAVVADLERVGFTVRTARAYGRCRLRPRRIAFIATRRRKTAVGYADGGRAS
jgi:hypothetical protein